MVLYIRLRDEKEGLRNWSAGLGKICKAGLAAPIGKKLVREEKKYIESRSCVFQTLTRPILPFSFSLLMRAEILKLVRSPPCGNNHYRHHPLAFICSLGICMYVGPSLGRGIVSG